jgi:hypothetical protein
MRIGEGEVESRRGAPWHGVRGVPCGRNIGGSAFGGSVSRRRAREAGCGDDAGGVELWTDNVATATTSNAGS